MNNQICVPGIIGHKVNRVFMLAVHARMHHKDAGFYGCAFAGFEDHRTDGQIGRSASLQDFDIRILFKTQRPIAGVGNIYFKLFVIPEWDIAIVDLCLVNGDHGGAASVPTSAVGEQEYGSDQEDRA
jgi:hypothetical protein